jgi:hypothetical protein
VAVIFSDTFTVAADTELTLRAPDVGTAWVKVGSVNLSAIATTDNVASPSGSVNTAAHYLSSPDPTSAEYDVGFTFSTIGSGTVRPVYAFARYVDANNYYVAGTYVGGAANDKRIFKKVAGVVTELAAADTNTTAGDIYRFECRNTAKRLLRNGTQVLTSNDDAITAIGSAGFGMGNAWSAADGPLSSHRLDNYLVDEVAAAVTRRGPPTMRMFLSGPHPSLFGGG